MGKVSISGAGGAGAGSDECTSTSAEVLKGFTAITVDSHDEVVEGTLELTGDAADSQVLIGKSYYNTNPKNKRTGCMVNHGAVSQALNAGESYTVPAGYHNGSGMVTVNSLASQTSATATSTQILNGQTAWVNGKKLIGTMTVGSILSFSAAAYSTNQILLQWRNPYAASGKPFSGVFINYSTSGYPSETGGTRIYTGYGNNTASGEQSSVVVTMPSIGTTYYFSCYTYASCSAGDMWGPGNYAAAATTARGQQVVTESGTFTVPAGVRTIDVFCVGGGSGGGGGTRTGAGGGGGGGYTSTTRAISVNPGQQIPIIIGNGGAGCPPSGSPAPTGGGATYIIIDNNLVNYAKGSEYVYNTYGGSSGGSGGGGGGQYNYKSGGGRGGSDGGDGISPTSDHGYGGRGQGLTTRAFGETWNTLYAGGGGGGGNDQNGTSPGGAGGAGGGGRGSDAFVGGASGSYGTGGGGGGGYQYGAGGGGLSGGSGICIIRWGY